jgi:hypothetical protein
MQSLPRWLTLAREGEEMTNRPKPVVGMRVWSKFRSKWVEVRCKLGEYAVRCIGLDGSLVQYDLDWANDVLLPGEDGCPCDPKTRSIDEIQIGDQFWILLTDNKRWLKGTVKERKGHTTFELKWPDTQVLWLPRKEDDSNHSDLCMAPPEARAVHTDPEPKEPKSFETLSFANGARPNPRWTMETVCPDCGYKWKYHYSSWISCKHVCVVTPGPEEWARLLDYSRFEEYIKDTELLKYGMASNGPFCPAPALILFMTRDDPYKLYVMQDRTANLACSDRVDELAKPEIVPTPLTCEMPKETADPTPKEKDMQNPFDKPDSSWNMTTVCPECGQKWGAHYSREIRCKHVDMYWASKFDWCNEALVGNTKYAFKQEIEHGLGGSLLLIISPEEYKKEVIVCRDATGIYDPGRILSEVTAEALTISNPKAAEAKPKPKPKLKPLLKHNYNVQKCGCDLGDRGCMCPRPGSKEEIKKPVCNHAELKWVNELIVEELGYQPTTARDHYSCMQCGRIFGIRVWAAEKKLDK